MSTPRCPWAGLLGLALLAAPARAGEIDRYLPDDSEVVVCVNVHQIVRSPLWTVGRPLAPGVALAWSEQRIGFCGGVHDTPVHPAGTPVDLAVHPALFWAQGTPVLSTDAPVYGASIIIPPPM